MIFLEIVFLKLAMPPIDDYIKVGTKWSQLPPSVQTSLNLDPAEYDARVLIYFLQNQLEYSSELIKDVSFCFIHCLSPDCSQ